jgi:hypothetical protein
MSTHWHENREVVVVLQIELNWLRLWLKGRFVLLVLNFQHYYKNDAGKPHSKYSITKSEELKLFMEIIILYWEKHINTLFGQNKMFLHIKAGGVYSDYRA